MDLTFKSLGKPSSLLYSTINDDDDDDESRTLADRKLSTPDQRHQRHRRRRDLRRRRRRRHHAAANCAKNGVITWSAVMWSGAAVIMGAKSFRPLSIGLAVGGVVDNMKRAITLSSTDRAGLRRPGETLSVVVRQATIIAFTRS